MIIYMVYDGPHAVITKLKTIALHVEGSSPFASQNTEHTHWPQYGYDLKDWVEEGGVELEDEEEDDDNWYEDDDNYGEEEY